MIVPISRSDTEAWISLRKQLWPHCTEAEHRSEIRQLLSDPSRFAQFLYLDKSDISVGFAEVSIRSDYVNGAVTSPVAFLEGIFVEPHVRKTGIARRLVEEVSAWAKNQGLSELASDADLSNVTSHAVHEALGFEERERVVFFRISLEESHGA